MGDLLLAVTLRIRPYEVNEGETNAVHGKWQKRLYSDIINNNRKQLKLKKVIDEIIADFDAIEIDETVKKPKVGVVGEILVKFHPDANNNIIDVVSRGGGRGYYAGTCGLYALLLYNNNFKRDNLGLSVQPPHFANLAIWGIESFRKHMARL